MPDISIQWIAAAIFAIALLHTFSAKQFERLSHRYPRHSGLFHLLGEVEVVFGFWAIVLVIVMALVGGGSAALGYAESRNYTEPLFVFVVMVIAASRPGNRFSAMSAPSGAPMTTASTVALRLTIKESRTMANRVGSPRRTNSRADVASGIQV